MALMKAVQVSKPGGQFELVERPIPEPGRGQVRIFVTTGPRTHAATSTGPRHVMSGRWTAHR